jgi:hypothetical protein
MSGLLDDGIEPGVFVSSVMHCPNGAVGLDKLVVTFNFITVSFLSLLLDIPSVIVFHSVLELVMRRSLKLLKVM